MKFRIYNHMEQHPIPQDVTGFQFKLIGTMTVKQFGYVAVGAIFAVICYYAPVQALLWQIIVKGLLMPLFGISGVIVAFVPIEGRPVDVMTVNFMHALFSPNQYVYIKRGKKFSFSLVSYTKIVPQVSTVQKPVSYTTAENKKEQQLRALLASGYKNAKSNIDKKELAFLESFTPVPQAVTMPQTIAVPQTKIIIPAPKPVLHKPASTPTMMAGHLQIASVPKAPAHPAPPPPKAEVPQQAPTAQVAPIPLNTNLPPTPSSAHIKNISISQDMPKNNVFSHIPETPNLITGIVKDSRGNMLTNILIEIKDKDGTPVRAFKTNPLGQFASATPLADGNYTIELEDPKKQHTFDTIPINAKGQIILPIEIISHDAREELRKALFN